MRFRKLIKLNLLNPPWNLCPTRTVQRSEAILIEEALTLYGISGTEEHGKQNPTGSIPESGAV